jgi:penicillin V acylase-like amidase (Ntn superfamily)
MENLFKRKLLQLLIVISFITSSASLACSSFVQNNGDNFVFGYNNDYPHDVHLYVITNTRGITKEAFVEDDNPAKWTSKYGSITFNMGKEYPMAGMNEKGLVVSNMTLAGGGKYSEKDERPGIDSALPWVQYQLDNSASVEDVINSDKKIRLVFGEGDPSLHFLVSDKEGNIAVIEFLRGKMVVHTGDELPIPLVTNYKYDSEIKKLVEFMKFGVGDEISSLGSEPMNMDTWIKDKINFGDMRSIMGTYMLKKNQKELDKSLVDSAFVILESMHMYSKKENFSQNQFTAVFDPINMQIYYYTKKNSEIRKLDFKDFDLITPSLGLMYDMDLNITNVKNDFIPYSSDVNKKLLQEFITSFVTTQRIPIDSPLYKEIQLRFDIFGEYPETLQYPGKELQNKEEK